MFSFFVVVVDGPAGRLLGHESFTDRQRAALTHIIANAGKDAAPPLISQAQLELVAERVVENNHPSDAASVAEVAKTVSPSEYAGPADYAAAVRGKTARQQGYTGDACTQCHGFRVKQTGKCTVCEDCHATSGCS